MSLPNNNKPKRQSRISESVKFYRDRHKREGIVPKYQEPRSVIMPDEPSPKAKELLKQGKKLLYYRDIMDKKRMRDLRMLRLRLRSL